MMTENDSYRIKNLIETGDGSLTLRDVETGELYHNRAGAYTEALQNYVLPAQVVEKIQQTGHLDVLDTCFGLGYNTWVLLETLLKEVEAPFTVSVLAIERDPEILKFCPSILNQEMFYNLNTIIDPLEHNSYYQTLQNLDWGQ